MLLAGDIGGTKTLIGLFEPSRPRPRAIAVSSYTTLEHRDLASIVDAFTQSCAQGQRIDRACFGVAGPVLNGVAQLTNVPWTVDVAALAGRFGFGHANLLNDLEAMAYGVPVLEESEVHVLQARNAVPTGNIGLIAAGTGLGVALLHNVNGVFMPVASEGGHADFAATGEREIGLLRWLIDRYGRADVEHVVSGRGLLNIHRYVHRGACPAVADLEAANAAAAITDAALAGQCQDCVETLDIFVTAYGAEAGNLALRTVSTAGVYVGGGIAPKILPALGDGRFMRAFSRKPPYVSLLGRMPVKVILNSQTALLGSAVFAAGGA
jgi:glucokinase